MAILDPLRGIKHRIQQVSLFGPPSTLLSRLKLALSYQEKPFRTILPWLVNSREFTNFTYDLEPLNILQLTGFIEVISQKKIEVIEGYIRELQEDLALKDHIARLAAIVDKEAGADRETRYGRRLGWYAIVRALKPRLVIETGVDKGLGSCVLSAALKKNAEEGNKGRLYALDINPRAGYFLQGEYAKFGEMVYGDSIESLSKMKDPIDIFINDSDHSQEYEAREYETIESRLSPNAVVLGDNSHCSPKLYEFARRTGRHFLFFQEVPKDHWYPGGGIGVAYRKARPV